MVNPVGSYATKYWYKTLIPLKEQMFLNQNQKSLIIGSLLGDGTMRIGEGSKNANFKVEQGLMQKEYTFWKYQILKPLVLTEPKISFRYHASGEKYQKSWWFRTVRHPILTDIYALFYEGEGYRNGRKIVPKSIQKYLDPLAIAVWIMDDGSFSKGSIDISTYSFLEKEIKLLQKSIFNLYGIEVKYHPDRDKGFRMRFSVGETKKLIEIILPHVVPSLQYKLGA